MKKFTFLTIIIAAICISAFSYYQQNKEVNIKQPLAQGKVNFEAKNIDDLIISSEVIIEAIATDKVKNANYLGANFVQTVVEVKKVYKGSEHISGKEIHLLQTLMVQDPLIKKDERVLLFLEKYTGPVTSDVAFISKGLFQGHYKIKKDQLNNDKLTPSVPLSGTLMEDFEQNKSYEKMVEKINKKSSL